MARDQVTTVGIADANITTAKIANNAVDETKLKDALVGDFSEVVVTAADSILLGDDTDSGNTKRDTVQGLLDLIPSEDILFYHETQSSGTNSPTTYAVGGWRTVALNAEVYDTGNNGTLSTNVIALVAGTYRATAYFPAHADTAFQATLRLRNTSDNSTVCISNYYKASGNDTIPVTIHGRMTIASTKNFELQIWPETATITPKGDASDGDTETYGWVKLEKE